MNRASPLGAIEHGHVEDGTSADRMLPLAVPSLTTLIVQLCAQADHSIITSVRADGAGRAFFVAAPPAHGASQSITLDDSRAGGGVRREGSLVASLTTIGRGAEIDGDITEGSLVNSASCVQTAGSPCAVLSETHSVSFGFVGTLPQPSPPMFMVVRRFVSGGSPTSVVTRGATGECSLAVEESGINADQQLAASDASPSTSWLSSASPNCSCSARLSDTAAGGSPCALVSGAMTCTLVSASGQSLDVASSTVLGTVTMPVAASALGGMRATNVVTVSDDGSSTVSNHGTVTVSSSPSSSGGSSGAGSSGSTDSSSASATSGSLTTLPAPCTSSSSLPPVPLTTCPCVVPSRITGELPNGVALGVLVCRILGAIARHHAMHTRRAHG